MQVIEEVGVLLAYLFVRVVLMVVLVRFWVLVWFIVLINLINATDLVVFTLMGCGRLLRRWSC
jgi:hypothetical protein